MGKLKFLREKGKRAKIEAPIAFDGVHTYQLIIKSRALDYIASIFGVFRDCKIVRIRLDGSSQWEQVTTRYNLSSLPGYTYAKEVLSHIRLDGTFVDKNGIDLVMMVNELKFLKPSTLYILEMDIETDSGMKLRFNSRQMKIDAVKERIDSSRHTLDNPLILQSIFDIETIRNIRKNHLGRRLTFILVGQEGMKETTIYSVLKEEENGE